MLLQQRNCQIVALVNETAGFLVDLTGDLLRVITGMTEIATEEYLLLIGAVDHGTQLFAEAVAADHGAGNLGGTLQIIGGAGGDILQHQLFGNTTAQQYCDLLLHPPLGLVADILLRQRQRKAARPAAGHNGNLMHLILLRAVIGDDGMTRLVISGEATLLIGDDMAALFGTDGDLEGRFLNVLHGDGLAVLARCQQRCLIGEVFKIGAGKAAGKAGDHGKIDIGTDGLIAGVNAQNRLTALDIGIIDGDMAVETAGAQQRRVQNILAVGCRHDDDAQIGGKAVHFHQKLVEGLLSFIMTAAETGAAVTTHGIDLIDEHDAGRALFRLLKQITDTGGADADEHLDEIGAGDGEERHARFAGDCLGKQGLTGSGRAHEQNALGDTGTQRIELAGILEELDDFLQLLLFLIGTCHIGKGDTIIGILLLGLELGKRHWVAAPAGALHEDIPEAAHEQDGEQQRQHIDPPRHCLGSIVILLDRSIGVLGVVLLYQIVRILQEQAEIGNGIGNGGLFFIIEQHGQLAGAEIQLIFRNLLVFEVIDDGTVLHLGLCGIKAENPDRHVEE